MDDLEKRKVELCKQFGQFIYEMQRMGMYHHDFKRLFLWTTGTIGKQYDEDEQAECIGEDTLKWIQGEAEFMYNHE